MRHDVPGRPDRSQKRGAPPQADGNRRKQPPAEKTFAEEFYFTKQMTARTPMVVVLDDGERVNGWIEWYDQDCIKVHRHNGPNLLIYKRNIKYLFKDPEELADG